MHSSEANAVSEIYEVYEQTESKNVLDDSGFHLESNSELVHEKEGLRAEQRELLPDSEQTWDPTWKQIQPLSGLMALTISAISMLVSLAILVASDGRAVSSWNIQPTVYLAIAAATGIASMRFAYQRGAPIAWWYKAVNGDTIDALESHWQISRSLLFAFTRYRHSRWISAASLVTSLMIIDAAMLQRASSVIPSTSSEDVTLNVILSPELPTGFSGTFEDDGYTASPAALEVFEDHMRNRPILPKVSGCKENAICTIKVYAPGLTKPDCTSKHWPITAAMLTSPNATWGPYHQVRNVTGPMRHPGVKQEMLNSIFLIDLITLLYDNRTAHPETIGITIGIGQWPAGEGSYVWRDCYVAPAVLEYTIHLKNGQVIVDSDTFNGRIVAPANNTRIFSPDIKRPQNATMSGFAGFLNIIVGSDAKAIITLPREPGDIWAPAINTLNANVAQFMVWKDGNNLTFYDPLPSIVSKYNELMFRGGIYAAEDPALASLIDQGLDINQTVAGKQEFSRNVFSTDFRWFAGAAVLDLLAIAVVLPLYWGWWLLPSRLSHSPFELALAFNSPITTGVHSGTGFRGVLSNYGDIRVAYGFVEDNSEGRTHWPLQSEYDPSTASRLAIARQDGVVKPRKGARIMA